MGHHDGAVRGDVLVVAHGHILRAFAQRWAGKSLQEGPTFLLEAGGVGTLRYGSNSGEGAEERELSGLTGPQLRAPQHQRAGNPPRRRFHHW
jgi:broad specificity phosphatase PhoE